MQSLSDQLIFSATDLSKFLACLHRTLLNRRTALGGAKPQVFPGLEVLRQRGLEHEQKTLLTLQNASARVTAGAADTAHAGAQAGAATDSSEGVNSRAGASSGSGAGSASFADLTLPSHPAAPRTREHLERHAAATL